VLLLLPNLQNADASAIALLSLLNALLLSPAAIAITNWTPQAKP
jgi:hypothetical protein